METKNKFNRKEKQPMTLDSVLYGKIPPQNTEMEAAVLGVLMLEPRRISDVMEIIQSEECFYSDANQRIYAAIKRLYSQGTQIDCMTVSAELRKSGEIDQVGGSYYITGLTRDVVGGARIEAHARMLIEKYILRELIRICGETIGEAYSDGTDPFELMGETDKQISRMIENNISMPYQHLSHRSSELLEEIHDQVQRLKETGTSMSGVPSGFPTLDRITNGWQKTDLIILAARPAVGKTAFVLNLLMNAATHPDQPIPVAIFSLEMSASQLKRRIIASRSEIGLTNINSGRLDEIQLDQISHSVSKFPGVPMFIDDSASMTLFQLKAKARSLKKKHNIGLLAVDYLQLISPDNPNAIREQQVSAMSRELKILAKELDIPIIVLSQLNRDIEKRAVKRPTLADLRESGSIEQDADIVAFLYRPEPEQGESIQTKVRLEFAKHRSGKIDYVDFRPNLNIQKFIEADQDFPAASVQGFSPTEHSGRLIPMAEALKKFDDETDDLPF